MATRVISFLLVGIIPLVSISSRLSWAEVITAEQALQAQLESSARLKVAGFLSRSDVAPVLSKYGIPAKEAIIRLETLSDQEVEQLAKEIDSLPAGGDGVSSVIGAIVLIFIVLLVTDILGFTKVFPFTRSVR